MTSDRILIVNGTGLTIWTSALADVPAVAIGPGSTEIRRDAWEHTLACDPGLLLHSALTTREIESAPLSVAVSDTPPEAAAATLSEHPESAPIVDEQPASPAPAPVGRRRR